MRFSQWLMVLVAFLALTIQSFVVQTHIHIPQGAGKTQTLSVITLASTANGKGETVDTHSANAPRDKYPINEDPSNCPLCQEFSYSGQFVANAAVLATLPVAAAVSFIVFTVSLPSLLRAAHNWQGRAPPSA
jgi:Protein of unknown function (DUF2946)